MIDVLDLHRRLVAIRSVSHHEAEICNFVQSYLSDYGVETQRIGDNVAARAGKGPMLVLNSHLDTVPPTEAWTREPWKVTIQGGKVYGLGANDAKASVAAMIATFIRAKKNGANLGLLLACEEETGGKGTEFAWPILQEQGWDARGVVVGEPTGLNIATSQKGMLLLELHSHGDACHAANATAMGATNAITELARDLVAIHDVDLGPAHPHLGGTTLQPTVLTGGRVRNQTPHHAHAVVDLRTVPTSPHADLVTKLTAATRTELRIRSDRLHPFSCPEDAGVVLAAQAARPASELYGSPTMSDLVFFRGLPGIKVGPGKSERSHRPDEFVMETEVQEGEAFYGALVNGFCGALVE